MLKHNYSLFSTVEHHIEDFKHIILKKQCNIPLLSHDVLAECNADNTISKLFSENFLHFKSRFYVSCTEKLQLSINHP